MTEEPLHPGNDGIPQHAAREDAPYDPANSPPIEAHLVPRPEPVLDAAKVAGTVAAAIIAIGGVLRVLGWFTDTDFQDISESVSNAIFAVAGLWALIGPWLMAKLRARDKVTPLADPRDSLGRKLIAAQDL